MKAELTTLRQQATDLERLLREMQTRRHATTPDFNTWEQIAMRQKRARENAEAQNALMKRTLDARAKYVMDIEESLFKLQQIARQPLPFVEAKPYLMTKPLAHKIVRLEPGDDALFEMMLMQLDSAYSKLGHKLHTSSPHGVESARAPYANPQAKRETDRVNGQIRSFVEMSGVEVMPFDLELLARVSWICSKRKNDTWNCIVYQSEKHGEDVVAAKARVRRVYNATEVYLHVLCVSKQFVVEDRVVTAWIATIKGSDGLFPDSYVQETGCTVSMRSAASETPGEGSAPSPKTVRKTVIELEPKRFSISPPLAQTPLFLQADADVLTRLLVDSYADDTREVNEMMENMLLDEVAKRRSR